MNSLNALSGGKSDDLEALTGGFTNKKDDSLHDSGDGDKSFDGVKKNLLLLCRNDIRFSVTAIIVITFSIIGVISVGRDLSTYSQRGQRAGTQGASIVVTGGELMMMTDSPDADSTFDGHIDGHQTNSLGMFSKLFSSELHGGEKTIAKVMENILDVDDPSFPDENEITFLWEAGAVGSIANEICRCFPIRMATTFGEMGNNPLELRLLPTEGNACGLYNINMGIHSGTQRAKDLGLISRRPGPNFISSPFLPEIASLFTAENKGRAILVVPNTAVRIRFSYDHLVRKGMFDGSMLEFVSSDHILANNYLTHVLSGKWGGGVQELTEDDFAVAVAVVSTKLNVFTWADNRKMVEYLTRIRHDLDPAGLHCMYPPENPYSQEQEGKPRPPPPEKTAEELATETAVKLHNYWDNRLWGILAEVAQQQAASIRLY